MCLKTREIRLRPLKTGRKSTQNKNLSRVKAQVHTRLKTSFMITVGVPQPRGAAHSGFDVKLEAESSLVALEILLEVCDAAGSCSNFDTSFKQSEPNNGALSKRCP